MDVPSDMGDEAVPPDVGEAAQLLNLLDQIGLRGEMLAVSEGSERELAVQLAERAGVSHQQWHVDFVKGQVRAAKQMEDLDRRVGGSAMSVGHQQVIDARAAFERQVAEESQKKEEVPDLPVPAPKRGLLGKSVRLRTGRVVTEDAAEEKVLRALTLELRMARAPVVVELEKVANKQRALQALTGKYRPSTLRRYLAGWQHYRKWCDMGDNKVTGSHVCYIDYLYVREEEGMGPSIPLAVHRAVGWFQELSGIPEDERLNSNLAVDLVVKELVRKLETKAAPIKRAPRWLSVMVGPMEEMVMSEKHSLGIRVAAWMKLVKLWAALRFSDAANIRASAVKFYDGKLTAILTKTKTTGAGKRVRELPLYVDEGAFVFKKGWLETGYKLVKMTMREEDQFLFSEGAFSTTMTGVGPMKYYEASGASEEVIGGLVDHEGQRLLPQGVERFWSEHSERSTLPSALAALGVPKAERDLIGRWQPEGSDAYVRTYNAAVGRLQRQFAKEIRGGRGYASFDEGSVLEEIKDWLVTHWKVDRTEAERGVENLKVRLKRLSAMQTSDDGTSGEETEVVTPEDEEDKIATGFKRKVQKREKEDLAELIEERPKKDQQRKKQNLAEDRFGGYVIVYQRAGRGTLHQLGPQSCWMARKRSFVKAEIFEECPDAEQYSNWCKLCWREEAKKLDESTSDSCDDLELSDVTDGWKR